MLIRAWQASQKGLPIPAATRLGTLLLAVSEGELRGPLRLVQRKRELHGTDFMVFLPPLLEPGQQASLFPDPIVHGHYVQRLLPVILSQLPSRRTRPDARFGPPPCGTNG